MSRFLSPVKICLVLLIDVYHLGEVQQGDVISILSFISTHVLQGQRSLPDGDRNSEQAIEIDSVGTIKSAIGHLSSNLPGRSLYDVFLKSLWRMRSPDQLDDLFERPRSTREGQASSVQPITVTSPIGQFLRRCQLEFTRLQFSDAQQLWESFIIFRESSRSAWASRNPDEAASVPIVGLHEDDEVSSILIDRYQKEASEPHASLPSQDVLDRTVGFQLQQIQANGCRLPPEMDKQIEEMIRHSSSRPAEVFFIKFFDAWRAGAYNDAIDNLHRYFDYAMEAGGAQKSAKSYHQYACLHLAVLHADFGCFDEAITAMQECIATARENQDSKCLNFGLSWLIHLRKAHPEYVRHELLLHDGTIGGNDQDVLSYLQQKALDDKDWTQLSSALLSQAEGTVNGGAGVAKAFEQSIQSGHLNLKYGLLGLQPNQTRLHGSLYGQIGAQPIATMQSDTFNIVFAGSATKPESLSMACVQAYQSAVKGECKPAMRILIDNDPSSHRTLRLRNLHLGVANMIKLKQALHNNDMFTAQRLLQKIEYLRTIAEPDIAFETHLLELDYLRRSRNTEQAFKKIAGMLEPSKAGLAMAFHHRLRLLIAKADLWVAAGKPARGFSLALRAANAAYLRLLQPLMWAAISALVEIMNDLEEYDGARQLLDSILPRAVEGGDLYLVARLYGQLTDALGGIACKQHEKGSKERDGLLNSALVYLERSKDAFEKMEDFEGTVQCLEKKAMLFRYRGETALAEEVDRMRAAEMDRDFRREREAMGYLDE